MQQLTPQYYAALRLFLDGNQKSDNPPETYYDLLDCGWIEPVSGDVKTYQGVTQYYDNCWAITPAGRMALSAYEKAVDHDAQEKRQNRIANNLAAINIVVNFICFAAGLLADHYLGIIDCVMSFFH